MNKLTLIVLLSCLCNLAKAKDDFPVTFTQKDISLPNAPCNHSGPTQIEARYIGDKIVATVITGFSGGSIARKPFVTNTEQNFVLLVESDYPKNQGTLCVYSNKLEVEFEVPDDINFRAQYLYYMQNGVVRSHTQIK